MSCFNRLFEEYGGVLLSLSDVQKDTELQKRIHEIFTHGFLGNKLSGFPAHFNTVKEVIRFITMLIFTVTVHHTAHNNGQVNLGQYPEERFDEDAPKRMIEEFQAQLTNLSKAIAGRNSQQLEVPYTHLYPTKIENSIAI